MVGAVTWGQLKTLKPGFDLFTPEQDIQLGKESKAQVEKTQPVVHNAQIDSYISGLGRTLAKSPRTGNFPFSFQVVSDKNINAFALPGGPVFINTATILAADNEGELAGVMAHEMSHVALRHGTHEASKSQAIGLLANLAGAVSGDGMLGQLTRAGVGLGANSVLLKYSRDAESQADYNGAQVMADAGYNPVQMAQFFQKLETRGSEGKLVQFLSDHPTPGNRVEAVQKEVSFMPQRNYTADSGQLAQIKRIVSSLPPPPPPRPIQPAEQQPQQQPAAQ